MDFTSCSSPNKGMMSPRLGSSLIWPIRGCAAGQGMVFGLSVLNRDYNFMQVCAKWSVVARLSSLNMRYTMSIQQSQIGDV